jgi:hypothetical protein
MREKHLILGKNRGANEVQSNPDTDTEGDSSHSKDVPKSAALFCLQICLTCLQLYFIRFEVGCVRLFLKLYRFFFIG